MCNFNLNVVSGDPGARGAPAGRSALQDAQQRSRIAALHRLAHLQHQAADPQPQTAGHPSLPLAHEQPSTSDEIDVAHSKPAHTA